MFGFFKKEKQVPASSLGALDPTGKPYEWFFSEEGKKSYEYHLEKYTSKIEEIVDDLINKGQISEIWSRSIGVSCLSMFDKTKWPYTFFYEFINSLGEESVIGSLQKNKRNGTPKIWGLLLYIFMLFTEDFNYPDIIDEEKNPFLYWIKHFRFLEGRKEERMEMFYVEVVKIFCLYILNCFNHGIDASREEWIYKVFNVVRFSEYDVAYYVKSSAKHKEYLPKMVDELAKLATGKGAIDDETLE